MTATLYHLIMVVNLCLQIYIADMDKKECEIKINMTVKECIQEEDRCRYEYDVKINGMQEHQVWQKYGISPLPLRAPGSQLKKEENEHEYML